MPIVNTLHESQIIKLCHFIYSDAVGVVDKLDGPV
jgi:hypothetical protein